MYIYISFACAKLAASKRSAGTARSLRVFFYSIATIVCITNKMPLLFFIQEAAVVQTIKNARRRGAAGGDTRIAADAIAAASNSFKRNARVAQLSRWHDIKRWGNVVF
ncbi:MAG: hypothetical protein J5700_04650 [Treponema sp.]|nr:hypothetical protein [Treponema sp.]